MAQLRTRVVRPDGTFFDRYGSSGKDKDFLTTRLSVRRGKVVPYSSSFDTIVLPSQQDDPSLNPSLVPPRRSSRRVAKRRSQLPGDTAWRPVSSVYATSDGETSPLGTMVKQTPPNKFGGSATDQISPPSSPEGHASRDRYTAGDVSPIDDDNLTQPRSRRGNRRDTQDLPSQRRSRTSSLPQPSYGQHANGGNLDTKARDLRSAGGGASYQQPHAGRSITPSEMDHSFVTASRSDSPSDLAMSLPSAGYHRGNTQSPSFGQRIRFMGKGRAASIDSRPAWKGASGRSAADMMLPVHDDVHVPPLELPRNNGKKADQGGRLFAAAMGSESSGSGKARATMGRLLQTRNKKPSPVVTSQATMEQQFRTGESSYPSPPHEDFPVARQSTKGSPPPGWHNQALSSNPPDHLARSLNSIRRKPPPPSTDGSTRQNYPDPDVDHGLKGNVGDSPHPSRQAHPRAEDALMSAPPPRFTSLTSGAPHTSKFEPRPPQEERASSVPDISDVFGVMDRKRPVTGRRSTESSADEPVVIKMSSPYTPAEASHRRPSDSHFERPHHRQQSDAKPSDRRESNASISKPLPKAPLEVPVSSDLVSTLNAQLSALAHRRMNIEKSIKQMTELMPHVNLMASDEVVRKREEEKQKVEGLQEELAEIRGEEYDLGIKLFRAYKRQDRDAEYEPTTLWVRRVAG